MKIALVTYGFSEYCIRQANAMARDHDVLLMMPDHAAASFAPLIEPYVQLRTFHRPRLRQPWRQFRSIQRTLRDIDSFAPDVVHYQHGHMWFNLALPRLRRYPLVITIHDPRHHAGDRYSRKTPQAMMDYGFRQADRVIVHGENLIEPVEKEVGIDRQRIHVIPHVAIGDGVHAHPKGHPEVAEDPHEVLFFGRIWKYKGLSYLIRAEPLIAAEVPQVHFTIAGRGDDMQQYRGQMVHPQRFTIHNGWIDDADRPAFFQRAAVVVLPYIEATQSGVVPVAYTYAKPVVATRVGGLPECVEHEVTGLLVPPRNERALADAVIRLLCDNELRHRMGQQGRQKLQRECAPQVVAEQNVAVYQRAREDFVRRSKVAVGA